MALSKGAGAGIFMPRVVAEGGVMRGGARGYDRRFSGCGSAAWRGSPGRGGGLGWRSWPERGPGGWCGRKRVGDVCRANGSMVSAPVKHGARVFRRVRAQYMVQWLIMRKSSMKVVSRKITYFGAGEFDRVPLFTVSLQYALDGGRVVVKSAYVTSDGTSVDLKEVEGGSYQSEEEAARAVGVRAGEVVGKRFSDGLMLDSLV